MDVLMFTPAGVLELLAKIDELKDQELSITESLDGQTLQVQIGDSVYEIEMNNEREIPVDDTTLIEVDDANVEAYQELVDNDVIDMNDTDDSVESGVLTELAKTLLIGGMVRFVGKELKK